jgi:hypothetical protein
MNVRFSLGYVVSALAVLGVMLFLDGQGTFIYFTYVPAYVLVLVCVGIGILAAGKKRVRQPDVLLFAIATVVLVVGVLALPRLETSRRKGFFLVSTSLRPGMTIEDVRARLARFDQSPYSRAPSTYTFGYASAPGTTDVVVVRYDPTTHRIVSAEYSPD